MPHDVSLIATLAAGFGLAMVLGFAAAHLRMPPLVGYLLAGVLIGPATPGFVADVGLAAQLAEIGVMLLMFGVGLHFSLDDLMSVKRIAVPGAIVQIAVATALGMGTALYWGWSVGAALVFGLCLSVASTVVLLRALESRGLLETMNGRIAVGWLIVEDLVMVLALVLLPAFAGLLSQESPAGAGPGLWQALGLTLAKVAAFIALMLVVGRRVLPKVLWWVARTGSRELFTLCVISAAVGVAFGAAKLFDVSFALGAFFAGMVLRESQFSARAAEDTLPLQDAFAVLFFVSVGMLFDPAVILEEPLHVLATVAIVLVGKTLAAFAVVLLLRYPVRTAAIVAASLAQVGEFSFILAGLGMALGLLPKEGNDLILAAALISIALNPVMFSLVGPTERWLHRHTKFASKLDASANPLAELPMTTEAKYLAGHIVLVGWGRVGKQIGRDLAAEGVPYVVVESNREFVESHRQGGGAAVWGDATDPLVLVQAHIREARALVIATPETVQVRTMVETARTLNPSVEVIVRSHNAEEADLLERDGAGKVFVGEHELARAMVSFALDTVGRKRNSGNIADAGAARPS